MGNAQYRHLYAINDKQVTKTLHFFMKESIGQYW